VRDIDHRIGRPAAEIESFRRARALDRGERGAHERERATGVRDLQAPLRFPHRLIGLEQRAIHRHDGRLVPLEIERRRAGVGRGIRRGHELVGRARRRAVVELLGFLALRARAEPREDHARYLLAQPRLVMGDADGAVRPFAMLELRAATLERFGADDQHPLADERLVGVRGRRALDRDAVVLALARDADRARLGRAGVGAARVVQVARDAAHVDDVARLESERAEMQYARERGGARAARVHARDHAVPEGEALPLPAADDVFQPRVADAEVVAHVRAHGDVALRLPQDGVARRRE